MSIRILTVVVTLLVILSGRQYSEIRDVRGRLAECTLDSRHAAARHMDGQAPEIARTLAWLDAFYRAPEGLQRAHGLWTDDHPDYDGIAYWVFEVYLRDRLEGRTEEEAKHIVEAGIRSSAEWRSKHPQAVIPPGSEAPPSLDAARVVEPTAP